jgi:hypothetical protein
MKKGWKPFSPLKNNKYIIQRVMKKMNTQIQTPKKQR